MAKSMRKIKKKYIDPKLELLSCCSWYLKGISIMV